MQALGKFDAYSAKAFVFMGIAFYRILAGVSSNFRDGTAHEHTATGFASVLTNSEVTLRVRDMFGHNCAAAT